MNKHGQLRRLLPLALLLLLLGGCTQAGAAEQSVEEIPALEPGQTEVYGKIRTAFGNEILLVVGTPKASGRAGTSAAESSAGDGEEAAPAIASRDTVVLSPAGDGEADGTAERSGPRGERKAESETAETADAVETNDSAAESRPAESEKPSESATDGPPQNAEPAADGPPTQGDDTRAAGNRGEQGGTTGGVGITLDYSGEEITYQIPVTAKIASGQGENAKAARFTQLAEKNIVRLVLDADGKIVSVQVLA